MMTSSQIRQSFLDFFQSKQHTIVPSSSLLPDSPNLLFTNAGMNQFVPIFLGQTKCPYTPGRAADTQKCIRAGGKHNDLEDVGLDTYHHTFFEMLGNWSFGDYFKKEAIEWAWELVVEKWKFPVNRLYSTVYKPGPGEPSEFDQEAYGHWERLFKNAGLDPKVHICTGGKKDNFWMMGDTGPCGPCSEIHVDLTPGGDTKGSLVNKGDARCIEIWNLVFIQFNANPDGTFSPLPARHVDTGMGFERVTSIIQGTKEFEDFAQAKISNYETDIFRPIFDALEKLSGKKYGSTLPGSADVSPASSNEDSAETRRRDGGAPRADSQPSTLNSQQAIDIAFRVIADHIRTLSFAIADGIQPGNNDRNYVLRRILRRAVRYGRTLGFHEPFFYKLVDVLADTMGDVFPEVRAKKKHVQDVIRAEEEAFNKTLDRGITLFSDYAKIEEQLPSICGEIKRRVVSVRGVLASLRGRMSSDSQYFDALCEDVHGIDSLISDLSLSLTDYGLWMNVAFKEGLSVEFDESVRTVENILFSFREAVPPTAELEEKLKPIEVGLANIEQRVTPIAARGKTFRGEFAFTLYDTYGFPFDLTELMARERGLTVDKEDFEKLMERQRARARAAQKKTVISLSEIETKEPTHFLGYDSLKNIARVREIVILKDKMAVVLDASSCYAEMGGQVGDTGELTFGSQLWRIVNTQKSGNTFLHFIDGPYDTVEDRPLQSGDLVQLQVDVSRRNAIQRHHTVTHLLHWALHEVVSRDASQKGSFVGPDKLTFDFNSQPLTPQQVADVEKLVNERILENAGVSWTEVPYFDVKSRKDVMQFFGDKYGDTVRVVQIGGHGAKLDGYSMELCGGTHTRATGEIGLFRIVGEGAIAAGVRRIEAVAGLTAYDVTKLDRELIKTIAGKVNSPLHELEKKIESLLAHQKELEMSLKSAVQRNAAQTAAWLLTRAHEVNGVPLITQNFPDSDGDYLQVVADALKGRFKGVVVLGGASGGAVALVASVSPDFTAKVQAGKIIQQIAPIVGGKGGGKPDNARGGGKDAGKLDEALANVKALLG